MAPSTRNTYRPDPVYNSLLQSAATSPGQPNQGVLETRALTAVSNTATCLRPSTVAKSPQELEKRVKTDCLVCLESKWQSAYKLASDAGTCTHFRNTCGPCIQRLLETKVSERKLNNNAGLMCFWLPCRRVMGTATLKRTVSKAAFARYDEAHLTQLMSDSHSFVACLSPQCGKYFSIEDCEATLARQDKVDCPYCSAPMCLNCSRPWDIHVRDGCTEARAEEEADTMTKLKELGMKQCPGCNSSVQKHGGCSRMTCIQCKTEFCWACLASHTVDEDHKEECPFFSASDGELIVHDDEEDSEEDSQWESDEEDDDNAGVYDKGILAIPPTATMGLKPRP